MCLFALQRQPRDHGVFEKRRTGSLAVSLPCAPVTLQRRRARFELGQCAHHRLSSAHRSFGILGCQAKMPSPLEDVDRKIPIPLS